MTRNGDFQIARAADTAASTEISGRKTGVPCLRNTDDGPVFLIFAMPRTMPMAAASAIIHGRSTEDTANWDMSPISCIFVGRAFPPAD